MDRKCRKCKTVKPIEEFAKHKKMKLGYDTICLLCNREASSKWNKENSLQYNIRRNEWRKIKKDLQLPPKNI